MKTKTKKMLLSLALIALCSFASKAYVFTNNLLFCSVTITYEMWGGSQGCGTCKSGVLTIPAGQSVTIQNCPGFIGVCIVIGDIGGTSVASNHVTTAPSCHPTGPYGQSGTIAGCNNSGTWTAITGSSNWLLN